MRMPSTPASMAILISSRSMSCQAVSRMEWMNQVWVDPMVSPRP